MARKGNPILVRNDLNRSSVESEVPSKFFTFRCIRPFIPLILLGILLILFYILCLQMGAIPFCVSVIAKVAAFIGVKALSFILTKMGCSSTLAFVVGCAFRALVTTEATPSVAHWVLPGPSHQPHAAEEIPRDALRDHPVAIRSAPPVGLEIKQPLMGDEQRHAELSDRLNRHLFLFDPSAEINKVSYDDLIEKQMMVEGKIEITLLAEGYSRDRILANLKEMRECLFYKNGVPLKEQTLDRYLKQIISDPHENIPYRKIQKAIYHFDIFFSK